MSKRKSTPKPKRSRSPRRTPDARALEWATAKLERAIKQRDWHDEKLRTLEAEIPRLRVIIAALSPEPTFTAGDMKVLKEAIPMTNMIQPRRKPQIVAGMDVSQFVNQRPAVAPLASNTLSTADDDDAMLNVADGNLPKGTPLGE